MKLTIQVACGILLATGVLAVVYHVYATPSKSELDVERQHNAMALCEQVGDAARRESITIASLEDARGEHTAALKTRQNSDDVYHKAVSDCLAPHAAEERTEHHCAVGTVADDKGNCWAATSKQ
jgi:hypothetical protein